MHKDNVYDLLSRRKINEIIEENDLIVGGGRYLGVLPKGYANCIRDTIAELQRKKTQIDVLIREFTEIQDGYSCELDGALALLNVPLDEYIWAQHDLYVDSAGHCWIVKAPQK